MRRWILRGTVALVILAVVATGAAGWEVSERTLHPDFAAGPYNIRVISAGGGEITLSRTKDSTALGTFRLEWSGGSGRIAGILGADPHSMRRRLLDVSGAPPQAGVRARVGPDFVGDPHQAFGLSFSDVAVPDPLGPMPAWLVPGARRTWAIAVHGYGGTRRDELYVLPTLHQLGFPTMLVAYRNDPGVPRAPHGYSHLGQTEWKDVDADVSYALGHGAQGVILIGASMGGAIVLEEARHGSNRAAVRGLVLDSPALDFGPDMHYGARAHGVSGPIGWWIITSGQWALRVRAGFDFSDLDQIGHARAFRTPILLFQGDRDTAVPVSGADAFAHDRADVVTYVRVPGAGHVAAWNEDRPRYESALGQFLGRVDGLSPSP